MAVHATSFDHDSHKSSPFQSLPKLVSAHSGAVTSVAFASNGTRLVSCGADRQVVFRSVTSEADAKQPFAFATLAAHSIGAGSVPTLRIHPTQKFAVSCGAERQMQVRQSVLPI